MSSVSSNEEKKQVAEAKVEDEDIDDEEKKNLVTAILGKFDESPPPPAPSPPNGVTTTTASATTPTEDTDATPTEDDPKKTAREASPSPAEATPKEEKEEIAGPADDVKMTAPDDTDSKKKSPQVLSPSTVAATNSTANSTTSEEAVRENDTSKPHVLPADFEPTPAHVLCGRRKGHKDFGSNWPGNLALEQVIAEHLDEYESVSTEEEQAKLVTRILAQVRASGGGFVRISMLQDDEKKSQQRWMDIGDNARKDVGAIFKLFAQARQNQIAQQQGTPPPATTTATSTQGNQQKRASPQKGLLESPQGKPEVQHIQLAARLQVMSHAQNGKEGFQLPSKVPTKLYVIEEKNAKRARAPSVQEDPKKNTAMMEHYLDAASAMKAPRTGTLPYGAAAAAQAQQFKAGMGQRAAMPPAGAMLAPAAIQPLVDRPRKRVST